MSSLGSSKMKSKKALEKDVKECLKLLEAGDVHLIDLDGMNVDFVSKSYLGDHLQYELHNYCRKEGSIKTNLKVVTKLAEMCYSNLSVSQFKSSERFVGCVYYISSYLLKKEVYQSALDVAYSLTVKKDEILKASKKAPDIRNFLYNLHSNFLGSAVLLGAKVENKSDANYKLSFELAMASLKLLQLSNVEQSNAGKKVLKTSKLYLHTIKLYNDKDFIQFYSTLKDVLKILLPEFGDHSYPLFYICKLEIAKNVELSKGPEIQNQLKTVIYKISSMISMSLKIKNMLDSIVDFFFAQNSQLVCDWQFKSPWQGNISKQLYFLIVCTIFNYGMQYWWKKYETNWCEISTKQIRNICKNMLDLYSSCYSFSSLGCTDLPGEFCFGDLLSGNLLKIQYTIRLCLKNKVPDSLSLVPLSQEAFKTSMNCVKTMKGKSCCGVQGSYAWKHSIIHQTNTIEDILRHSPSDESWTLLSTCSEEVLREIVNAEYDLPYDLRRVNILFQRWHYANLKLKKYQDALYVCAVFYICYPQEETEIMSMWILTKSESANEIFQETSFSDILKSCHSNLRRFKKKYESSLKMKSILMMEMKAYSLCNSWVDEYWKSDKTNGQVGDHCLVFYRDTFQNPNTAYKLVSKIWKQLQKLDLDIWETSLGLECLVLTTISTEENVLPENFIDTCKDISEEFLYQEHMGKKQCRSLFHAANLQLVLFLYNVKQAERSDGNLESRQLVLGFLKKAQEENYKFGEDFTLNLTCNVIPSSSQLTVQLEANYLNALNKIVSLWESAITNGFEELPSRFEFELWIQSVKQVAYLYELIGEYQRSFVTWLLCYKIGKLCDEPGAMLLGLTRMLGSIVDVDSSCLMKEAENLSEKLSVEGKEKETLISFWLVVASNHLHNKRSTKCLEYLCKIKKALEGLKNVVKSYILNAKFWCLVSQFLTLYPEFETEFGYPVGTDLQVMVFRAFRYANAGGQSEYIKSAAQGESTELVLAMLEVIPWAYFFFGIYSKTEFMRLFLGNLYQIVQKLFLPSRTAEILVRLAEVDILCEKTSDCEEKLSKLKSILQTLPSKHEKLPKNDIKRSQYLEVSPKRINVAVSPQIRSPTRFLDEPVIRREVNLSPVQFHFPHVKYSRTRLHVKECKCWPCQNILVQILLMNTLSIEGEMYKLENSMQNAAVCYEQAYQTMNQLEVLRETQSESLLRQLSVPFKENIGELAFQSIPVNFHSARFLIRHAFFECANSKLVPENVWKTIDRVQEMMHKFSYEEKLLMWTFAELKLCTIALGKEDEEPKKKTFLDIRSPTIAKTPMPSKSNLTVKANKENFKSPLSVKIENSNDSSSNAKNQASLFVEKNLPTVKKASINPKKLIFQTNESTTATKTVKKAPKENVSTIKPLKLDLEKAEPSEKKKVIRKRTVKK